MRRREVADCSSADDGDDSDTELNEASDPDTDPTHLDSDMDKDNTADLSWLLNEIKEGEDYPLEYYLNQEDEFNESEYEKEDYSDNSVLLFNVIEGRWLW